MLYRERIRGKATGASLTLFSKRIESGWEVTIEHIGFYAEVGATRKCNIYIEGHGYKHFLGYHNVENGVSERADLRPITIDDYERLAFEFDSLSAGEIIEVFLTGKRQKKA